MSIPSNYDLEGYIAIPKPTTCGEKGGVDIHDQEMPNVKFCNTKWFSSPDQNEKKLTLQEFIKQIFRKLSYLLDQFHCLGASLASKTKTLLPLNDSDKDLSNEISQKTILKAMQVKAMQVGNSILSLRKRDVIGSNVYTIFRDVLQNKYKRMPHHIDLSNVTHEMPNEEKINQVKEQKSILFIPFVIQGIRNHIVTLIINYKERTVEFYDSKGLTYKDRKNQRLKNLPDETQGPKVQEFIDKVLKKYIPKDMFFTAGCLVENKSSRFKMISNTKRDQLDAHNCGVYVLYHIEKVLKDSLNQISNDHLTLRQADGTRREEMISDILDYVNKNPDYLKDETMQRLSGSEDEGTEKVIFIE